MNLVRSYNNTIHRPQCRYARNATPWVWALRQTPEKVMEAQARYRYRSCSVCRPLTPK